MGRGVWRDRGGIQGLAELLAEHGEAVEYDLLTMGLRLADLGSRLLTWRDLLVIARNLPRTSALSRSINGEAADWGTSEHLLALIADHLAGANWQRGGGRDMQPHPVPRPGVDTGGRSIGSDPIPMSQFGTWWETGTTDGSGA